MALLRSPNPALKEKGAKYTVKMYPKNPELLQVAEEELLNGYQENPKDKRHASAMAWMCNVLGRSGQVQYKDTLMEVSKHAKHKYIRKYAKKNYKMLK